MTKRKLSEAAQVAAIIRKELRKHRIESTVRSKTYSMGESVTVRIQDELPATHKTIELYCSQFEKGYFDGMQDLYVYTHTENDIPRVKHLFVENRMSPDMAQSIYSYLRSHFSGMDTLDPLYENERNTYVKKQDEFVQTLVYRMFSGTDSPFWSQRKPRVKAN